MNLEIDNNDIEGSFDRIAKEILTQKALFVNEKVFRFTEIEFYYYYEGIHNDDYTHEHRRKTGEWRSHNQGLDITFEGNDISDGGILIRGVLVNGKYINGPLLSIRAIFEAFNKVTNITSFVLNDSEKRNVVVIKTFRHLPNKILHEEFHNRLYRYISDDIPEKTKKLMLNNSSKKL